ncbi:LexA family protein [Pseudomonas viridiflava]|uniref:LexA family protein n=3 Tax=Pseudomonas viridiflava TaxID=33069 RepID=UPI000F01A8C1|nr:S24 family peptidase [Pseudomonas viridiflava]
MIDKYDLRQKFSARLHEALDSAGVRKHGRGSDILARLKKNKVSKTPQAASKWLNGGAIPESDSMTILAEWLGVRREWLEYGVGDRAVKVGQNQSEATFDSPDGRHPRKVPLMSWTTAGPMHDTEKADLSADAFIFSPAPISKTGYALRVRGDSMTNPNPGKTYPPGCVIYVDPELKIEDGDRVIAKLPYTDEVTFKVFTRDAGRFFLKPLNPQYPTIELMDGVFMRGKIIGMFSED